MVFSGDLLLSVLIWCVRGTGMVHTQAGQCGLTLEGQTGSQAHRLVPFVPHPPSMRE